MNNFNDRYRSAIGSRTAKSGFVNETIIIDKFNNWKDEEISQNWLEFISRNEGFNIADVTSIKADKIAGRHKSDILLTITLKNGSEYKTGISLKKQDERGYNHIHREDPVSFSNRFNFDSIAKTALLKYCGYQGFSPYDMYKKKKISSDVYYQCDDIPEKKTHREGTGRFFFDELTQREQKSLLKSFQRNIDSIMEYILRTGKSQSYPADYVICTKIVDEGILFRIETINEIIRRALHNGQVRLSGKTKHPSIHIGRITVQRKGGTMGASDIQFKWTNIFPK
ncbi:MAG: hypothetical protein ACTSUC_19580 [Promethearchaeota archaeon]